MSYFCTEPLICNFKRVTDWSLSWRLSVLPDKGWSSALKQGATSALFSIPVLLHNNSSFLLTPDKLCKNCVIDTESLINLQVFLIHQSLWGIVKKCVSADKFVISITLNVGFTRMKSRQKSYMFSAMVTFMTFLRSSRIKTGD